VAKITLPILFCFAAAVAHSQTKIVEGDAIDSAGICLVRSCDAQEINYTVHARSLLSSKLSFMPLVRAHQAGQPIIVDWKTLSDLPYFDLGRFTPIGMCSVFELKIAVESKRQREIVLLTDGRMFYQITCNGQSTPIIESNRWLERFGEAQRVKLIAGINHLHIFLIGGPKRCSFALSIATPGTGRIIARENGIATTLEKYVYDPDEPISIKQYSVNGKITAWDLDGAKWIATGGTRALAPHSPGLHWIGLKSEDGDVVNEEIAVLDRNLIRSRMQNVTGVLNERGDQTSLADFAVFATRLQYLMSDATRRKERLLGDRDLVELLGEFGGIERACAPTSRYDWTDAPGRHFAAYFSKIATSILPYMIAMPSNYRRSAKLPLVVVMPVSSKPRPEFHESFPIDYEDLVGSYVHAGEKAGMIVLWPYAQNQNFTKRTAGLVDECIGEVERRFAIDPSRLYMIGACGGARDTVMFAARQRSGLAGIAGQELILKADSDEIEEREAKSTPISVVHNLVHTSIFLSHGELDRHVAVQSTLYFYTRLKAAGGNAVLDLIPGADEAYFPARNNSWIDDAFAFFSKSGNAAFPSQTHPSGLPP